jgi:tripartite-type tricarboxylate transporter receptor subunit TctC
MLQFIRCGAFLCAVVGATTSAQGETPQSYPDRPIRLVVAFVPGGATDTLARQIAQDLKEALGQSLVVDNRPGANGYLAWNHVASAEPDGYTLLLAENALAISQALYKKAQSSFDPVRQYDAIAAIATSPLVLAGSPKLNANSMAELEALSRSTPQKLNYGSAGIGSVSHLCFEVVKAAAGIESVHVPYKGGGQAMNDLIAGHIDMNMALIAVAKNLIDAGKIKGIAVTSRVRSPALPNVPSLQEAGIKTADVDLRFWWGIFAPAGTPEAVKAKLANAVASVMSAASVRERLAQLDIDPDYAPGDVLKQKLINEIANWARFIDEHGIKAE